MSEYTKDEFSYNITCPHCGKDVSVMWMASKYDHFGCRECGQSGWAKAPKEWDLKQKKEDLDKAFNESTPTIAISHELPEHSPEDVAKVKEELRGCIAAAYGIEMKFKPKFAIGDYIVKLKSFDPNEVLRIANINYENECYIIETKDGSLFVWGFDAVDSQSKKIGD